MQRDRRLFLLAAACEEATYAQNGITISQPIVGDTPEERATFCEFYETAKAAWRRLATDRRAAHRLAHACSTTIHTGAR